MGLHYPEQRIPNGCANDLLETEIADENGAHHIEQNAVERIAVTQLQSELLEEKRAHLLPHGAQRYRWGCGPLLLVNDQRTNDPGHPTGKGEQHHDEHRAAALVNDRKGREDDTQQNAPDGHGAEDSIGLMV